MATGFRVKKYVDKIFDNTGLLIKDKNENESYIAFYSGNILDTSKKMKLVVEYTDKKESKVPVKEPG